MRYFLFILVLFVVLFFFIAYFAAQKQNIYEPYEPQPRVLNEPVWPDRLPEFDPKG